jgi:hypothetical protein
MILIHDYVYDFPSEHARRWEGTGHQDLGWRYKDQNLYCGPAANVLTNAEGSGPSKDRRFEWQAFC